MNKSIEIQERVNNVDNKKQILSLSNKQNLSYVESIELNDLILHESEDILKKYGEIQKVTTTELHQDNTWEKGNNYKTSLFTMGYDFEYVEGYVITPNGVIMAHSWNRHKDTGEYYDQTIFNNEGYVYFGCSIPTWQVWDVLYNIECITVPILPFL